MDQKYFEKELGVTVSEIIREDPVAGRYFYAVKKNGSSKFLKIYNKSKFDKVKLRSLEYEAEACRILRGLLKDGDEYRFGLECDFGQFGDYYFSFREYFSGNPLGIFSKIQPKNIFDTGYLAPEYLPQAKKLLVPAAGALAQLHAAKADGTGLNTKNFRVDRELSRNGAKIIEKYLGLGLKTTIERYNKAFSAYCLTQTIIHDDFRTNNFIVTPEKQLVITDFELVCLDNPSLDYAMLWMDLWRYPKIQDEWQKFIPRDLSRHFVNSILRLLVNNIEYSRFFASHEDHPPELRNFINKIQGLLAGPE